MSSFVALNTGSSAIRVGNPTYKLIVDAIRERKTESEALMRIFEKNPIAESIGLINLSVASKADKLEFLAMSKELLGGIKNRRLTDGGFDRYEDLLRFVEIFEKYIEEEY